MLQPPPPPAPRLSSSCKFPEIERAYEAEHKVPAHLPCSSSPLIIFQNTIDTLHALLCYNGAELARALWSKMGDDATNKLYCFHYFREVQLPHRALI